jgi:beta-N-acetylhexosaminidase
MRQYIQLRPTAAIRSLFVLGGLLGAVACQAQPQQAATPPAMASGIVVLRNTGELLPLQRLDTLRLATISLSANTAKATGHSTDFVQRVADYAPTVRLPLRATPTAAELVSLRQHLRACNLVMLALPDDGAGARAVLQEVLASRKKVIVTVFSRAVLMTLPTLAQATAVLVTDQNSASASSQAAQVIFGGLGASGRLPAAVAARGKLGAGVSTQGGLRLRYASPTAAGLRANLPARVDSLLAQALAAGAFPGGQVIVARHGVVAIRKNYGSQAMGSAATPPLPVNDSTLYDFASLTKVTAALPALMRLQDLGKFNPDLTLGAMFDFLKGSNKQDLRLRDVLTHQARLQAFIPFWKDYVDANGRLQPQFFQPDSSAAFPLPVAAGIWGSRELPERMYQGIAASSLNAKPGYVYSDMSFMLYPYFVRQATGKPFDQFLAAEIYRPLGAATLGFNPEHRFPTPRIAPTEYDSVFRHQLVQGTVHDESAAMLGGLSGHAGLFGSANDLAKLVQMYLWQGRYGGQQLIRAGTMAEYTRCQFCPDNRRALALDKPDPKNPALNAARSASPRSYGHTGFTGTYFWVEPDKDLFVILLTNRVNPTRRNGKLGELGVRSALLQLAIESALP